MSEVYKPHVKKKRSVRVIEKEIKSVVAAGIEACKMNTAVHRAAAGWEFSTLLKELHRAKRPDLKFSR